MRATRARDRRRARATPPPALDPDEVAEAQRVPRLARGPPLHVPRLPRLRPRGGRRRAAARARSPARGSASCARPAATRSSRGFDELPPSGARARARAATCSTSRRRTRAPPCTARPTSTTSASSASTRTGEVVGERRFLGLYTHTAYHASPREIPILRRKVDAVLDARRLPARQPQREGADRDPRDATRATSCSRSPIDELFEIAMGILHLGERQRLRLFVRRDTFGRFLSCLVFVPRDRFNTENRRRIEAILRRAFRRARASTTRRASRSPCSCGCTTWSTPSRASVPTYDAREIETLLVAATRSWADDLESALVGEHGEERGNELCRRYGDAFPAAYRADWVRAFGGRRHRAHRGARRRRRPGAAASTARSRRRRGAARQAVPLGRAARALGHAAACSRTWA